MSQHATPPTATQGPLCATYAPLLALLGAGLLTDDEDTTTRAHLAECAWCRAQRAAQDVVDTALRRQYASTASVPVLRLEDIMRDADRPDDMSSVSSAPAATSAPSSSRAPRRSHTPLAALVALLVVALFAGLFYAVHNRPATATKPIATTTAVPVASATAAALPACQTSQLAIVMDNSGVALGHVAERLHFTNTSAHSCALNGYPDLQLLDARQQPMPTHLTRTTQAYTFTTRSPQQVALAPQATAYFSVEWGDVSATGQACPTDAASYLRITPPNQSTALLIAGTLAPCGGALIVSPVQAMPF